MLWSIFECIINFKYAISNNLSFQGPEITISLEYMDFGTLADVIKKFGYIPEVMLGLIAY